MNNRERFKAVAHFEKPDYYPIFGVFGAPGMSGGCMRKTYERLVATGMPDVGGIWSERGVERIAGWREYWGAVTPTGVDFGVASGRKGYKSTKRVENGFEIIEEETGAITRQVIDNEATYSMPEFVRYPVRDRESWEFFKDRVTPSVVMPRGEIDERCRKLDDRDRPALVGAGGTYGSIRNLTGPEALSLMMYDDPELVHDMTAWFAARMREESFPLIERLKPEIVQTGEDLCYNHGMLLSPKQFDEFFAGHYRELSECCRANDVDVLFIDSDGDVNEFAGVAAACGVNGLLPNEVKAGTDLFMLREKHPDMVFAGWLEKEVLNEDNEHMIEPEIRRKAPLLEKGGYFPNADHGIQPLATFPNACKFMTILHEVCGNPEGTFPRV